jgi:hypothetical protein
VKITTAHVSDFKRVRDIRLSPDADRYLVLIGGNNGQGKSSLLDALTLALGGKRAQPADPVRHGADRAVIEVAFDDGHTITRTITPDGNSKLMVRGPDGPVAKPQAMLDRIVGERFLDPLSFLAAPAKEQRRILLEVSGVDVSHLDDRRGKAFAKRTDVGRELAKARVDLERSPPPASLPPPPRPLEAVAADLAQLQTSRAAAVAAGREVVRLTNARLAVVDRIERMRRDLMDAEDEVTALLDSLSAAEDACCDTTFDPADAAARETALAAERDAIIAFARLEAQAGGAASRRLEAQAEVDRLSEHHDKLEATIADMDAKKAAALAQADLPVADLAFTEDGIELGGVPFEQASQAERLRCALGISMRLSPELRDVWVRDGSLLDSASLEMLAGLAADAGCRVWVERVGEADDGAIVIRDGRVMEPPGAGPVDEEMP